MLELRILRRMSLDTRVILVSIMAMILLSAGFICFECSVWNLWNLQGLPHPTDLAGALGFATTQIAQKAAGFFGLSFGTVSGTGAAVAALIRCPKSRWARVAAVWGSVQAVFMILAFFL